MEQLKNYIRVGFSLGSFEEGYINHCRVHGALLVVDNSDWYWYMRACYPGLLDRYLYMKIGCLYLEAGVEVLELDDELGVYKHKLGTYRYISDNKDVDGDCYNGTDI